MSLLGVEYALLLAIIAGICELVPYGILVALIPAVAFSYLSDGATVAVMVLGVYIIIPTSLEVRSSFSTLLPERATGFLSPIVIILAAVMGFELDGFWGLVLAIPSAVVFMELINDVEKHKFSARAHNDEKK